MEFGQRIRDLRKERGLSQRELAAQIGVDFTYLSKIEVGRMDPPSEAVIRKIAGVLASDPEELINLAGKVPKELKTMLDDNPQMVELLRVLSERKLPDDAYRQLLEVVREARDTDDEDEPPRNG